MKILHTAFLILPILLVSCDKERDVATMQAATSTPSQRFGDRDWKKDPPKTEFEELAYLHEAFETNRRRGRLMSKLELLDESGNVVGTLEPGIIIHSSGMTDVDDTDLSDNNRQKVLFDLPESAIIKWLEEKDEEEFGATWYRNNAALIGAEE